MGECQAACNQRVSDSCLQRLSCRYRPRGEQLPADGAEGQEQKRHTEGQGGEVWCQQGSVALAGRLMLAAPAGSWGQLGGGWMKEGQRVMKQQQQACASWSAMQRWWMPGRAVDARQ